MPAPHADDDRTDDHRSDADLPADERTGPPADDAARDEVRSAPADRPSAPADVAPDPAAGPAGTPSEAELARIARPATVRRAPRYRAFLVTGALAGAVLGLVLAVVLGGGEATGPTVGMLPLLDGENGARAVSVLAGAVVGAFAGGLVAVLADRRSTRGRR